jgi:hypothetical protein
MLWPLVLPFRITLFVLLALALLATVLAPIVKWKRSKAFGNCLALSVLAFVPSCAVITRLVDAQRFGMFEYSEYSQVQDFRIERYLPPKARDITLNKYAMGHRARYSITEQELMAYLDGCWVQAAGRSAIPREQLDEGKTVSEEFFPSVFTELGWPPLDQAIRLHSPVQGDGGGASYFFDPGTNTAYHYAGYW